MKLPYYSKFHALSIYETTHMASFVGLAICLVVWTPWLILTPGHVGISQVEQKIIK